jgi:hypothetical protein
MEKTPGQLAYERDLAKVPLYPADCGVGFMGTPRPTWDQLSKIARWSWERNPTDRPWVRASGVAGSGVVESTGAQIEPKSQ